MPGRRRFRLVVRVGNGVAAACAATMLLLACAAGYRGLPALGLVLDPGTGAWASASAGLLPESRVLALPGLAGTARVSFNANGIPVIYAATMQDAMVALGYLHGRFRLTQMDLQRRIAEGRLAQLIGPAGVRSDMFELRLGLLRTARQEWQSMPRSGTAGRMLAAYSSGVNDYLSQVRASGQWPAAFRMAGVYPRRWTPVDSLAVQGAMTEALDYTTVPLEYALLSRAVGVARTMRWLPVTAAAQYAYDPGPYRAMGVAQIAGATASARAASASQAAGSGGARGPSGAWPWRHVGGGGSRKTVAPVSFPPGVAMRSTASVARAAAAALATTAAPPAVPNTNAGAGTAWAVNGPLVAGGGSMLAAEAPAPDPLGSPWYQVAISAPHYEVTGISLPGLPSVVIGHNESFAWSLSRTQDQSALYYVEKTSPSRPRHYFWRGRWRRMRQVHYAIPVRGGPARHLTAELTVHGPVLTEAGQTVSVDWTGSLGSPDIAVLARLGAARNFAEFTRALANWRSPAVTFGYADGGGNIGAVTAGYYPVVRRGAPWMLMPGTGADDMAGVVPYAALPRSFDPPGHVIALAGQRPVTAAYPYYIGTTASDRDFFDAAGRAQAMLTQRARLRPPGLAVLQTSHSDHLAATMLPRLLAALRHGSFTPVEQQARSVLRGWNHSMDGPSAAAAIWAAFWPAYVSATFSPWLGSPGSQPPQGQAPLATQTATSGLGDQVGGFGLARALEQWTVADASNPVFAPPGLPAGTAASVMRAAFASAVASLRSRLGGSPAHWSLDRAASWSVVTASSAALVPVLGRFGVGQVAASDEHWFASQVPGAGVPESVADETWRMIVKLGGNSAAGTRQPSVWAEGIYPGGQSETPGSPWYASLVGRWRDGGYFQMPPAGGAPTGRIMWVLVP